MTTTRLPRFNDSVEFEYDGQTYSGTYVGKQRASRSGPASFKVSVDGKIETFTCGSCAGQTLRLARRVAR